MTTGTLAAALEREHRDIDEGIEAFLARAAEEPRGNESLGKAIEALRRHIFLEEEFVFPPLRDAGLVAPVFVMLREHGEIWDTLDSLDAKLASGADTSELSTICRSLLEQFERHNSKEEPILYPQADIVLTAAASADLRVFLAAGRIPENWVCARAAISPRGSVVGGPDLLRDPRQGRNRRPRIGRRRRASQSPSCAGPNSEVT